MYPGFAAYAMIIADVFVVPPPPPRRIPQRAFAVWRRARDGKATGGLSAAAATISTVMSSVVLAIPSVVTAFPAKRLPHIAEVLSM